MTDQTPTGAPHADDLTADDYARFLQRGGEAGTMPEIASTPAAVRAGDLLISVDSVPLGLNGVLVEASQPLDDSLFREYLGIPMQVITVWGSRRMIEMRVEANLPVTIRRSPVR